MSVTQLSTGSLATELLGPQWTLAIGPQAGAFAEREIDQWQNLQVAWPLLEGAGLSCTIPGDSEAAGWIGHLKTDLWAYRNNQLVFRGRITSADNTLSPTDSTIDLGVSDYRRMLNRRILWADRTYTQVDQAAIAWDLVNYTQAQAGGYLGITKGVAPVGRKRDRTYEGGSNIGELLDNLSEVIDGYDWGIDADKKFNVYYPQRGIAQQIVMDYGGAISDVKRSLNSESYINAVRVSGADTTTAAIRTSATVSTDPHGRWEEQIGFPDVSLQTTVNERADEFIRRSQDFHGSWSVTLSKSQWQHSPIPIQPGDTISLTVRSGYEDYSALVRITELSIQADASGGETIQLAAIDV